jgi:hypothetical protein
LEEEEIPLGTVLVSGTVTTPSGDRVSLVSVRLVGVYGDSLNPSYDVLAVDTTDATGAFLVDYSDCHAYPRFFVDLEIGCFPIGLREVGCGAWAFDFIWSPPGALQTPSTCSPAGGVGSQTSASQLHHRPGSQLATGRISRRSGFADEPPAPTLPVHAFWCAILTRPT